LTGSIGNGEKESSFFLFFHKTFFYESCAGWAHLELAMREELRAMLRQHGLKDDERMLD
jgi:hypothetical protein